MNEISESTKIVVILVVGILSLIIPLSFILMWGPQRFENKDNK